MAVFVEVTCTWKKSIYKNFNNCSKLNVTSLVLNVTTFYTAVSKRTSQSLVPINIHIQKYFQPPPIFFSLSNFVAKQRLLKSCWPASSHHQRQRHQRQQHLVNGRQNYQHTGPVCCSNVRRSGSALYRIAIITVSRAERDWANR